MDVVCIQGVLFYFVKKAYKGKQILIALLSLFSISPLFTYALTIVNYSGQRNDKILLVFC
jgi:ABC-type sulfate transport system permease subunit